MKLNSKIVVIQIVFFFLSFTIITPSNAKEREGFLDCQCYIFNQIENIFLEYYKSNSLEIRGDEYFYIKVDSLNNIKIHTVRNIDSVNITKLEEQFLNIDFKCLFSLKKDKKKYSSSTYNIPYNIDIIEKYNCKKTCSKSE